MILHYPCLTEEVLFNIIRNCFVATSGLVCFAVVKSSDAKTHLGADAAAVCYTDFEFFA